MQVSNEVSASEALTAAMSSVRMPVAGEVFAAACPSRVVLDHVTSKWGVLVLVALADGPQRWSELRRRAEGVSEKMLAQTLRTLEALRTHRPLYS